MTVRRAVEAEHCKALTKWRDLAKARIPELRWLSHIPNGGQRHPATAKQLKAEGTNAGVLDYILPVARGEFHGFWFEMKKPGRNREKHGGLTDEQREFSFFVAEQGYKVSVFYNWIDARDGVLEYLGMRPATKQLTS